jgi:predicted nucleic acid-binding protein
LEAEAVLYILKQVDNGLWKHISSDMVRLEIESIRDPELRGRILETLPPASDIIEISDEMMEAARRLGTFGIKPADAVHLAAAGACRADAFLTCDDRLLKAAIRIASRVPVRVSNPVSWVAEYEIKNA